MTKEAEDYRKIMGKVFESIGEASATDDLNEHMRIGHSLLFDVKAYAKHFALKMLRAESDEKIEKEYPFSCGPRMKFRDKLIKQIEDEQV